jgi:O-antigen ligase
MENIDAQTYEKHSYYHSQYVYIINALLIGMLMIYTMEKNKAMTISVALLLIAIILVQAIDIKIQSIFLLLPFQSAMILSGTISIFVIIEFILLLALLVNNKVIKPKYLFPLLGFVVMQLLSCLLYGANIQQVVTIVITLLSMCMLSEYFVNSDVDYFPLYAKSIVFSTILASAIGAWPNLSSLLNGLSISRFSGLWTNPNLLGMQLMVAAALTIALLTENKIPKIVGIISLGILGYFSLLTQSRTELYAITLIIVLAILMQFRQNQYQIGNINIVKKIAALTIICLLAFFTYSLVMQPIIEARGLISPSADMTSGRFGLLMDDYKWASEHQGGLPLLFGFGMENNIGYMKDNGFITSGTHNTFAEMLLSAGIIGFILWLVFLINTLSGGFRPLLRYRMLFVYVLLLYCFTAHLNTSDYMYLTLTLIMITNRKNEAALIA